MEKFMGWKRIKEYFDIEHIVQVQGEEILIGSPYSSRLLAIKISTGEVFNNSVFKNFGEENYPRLMSASKEKILSLINEKDSFSDSLVVYTYEDDKILKKFCEEYGYPNITHDGCIMYENSFFENKEDAIKKAKKVNEQDIRGHKEFIESLEKDLNKVKERLEKSIEIKKSLEEKYKPS